MQACGHGQISHNLDHNCIIDDEFSLNIRKYTSRMVLFPCASADYITAGGCSENQHVAQPLEQISKTNRNDMLQEVSSGLLQEEFIPGGVTPLPVGEPTGDNSEI